MAAIVDIQSVLLMLLHDHLNEILHHVCALCYFHGIYAFSASQNIVLENDDANI